MESTKSRILRINLSTQKTSTEPIDSSLWEKFYGGRGLGIRILYDEVGPPIKPLSPESKLNILIQDNGEPRY